MLGALLLPLLYVGLCALVFVPLEEMSPLHPTGREGRGTDALFATVGGVLAHGVLAAASGLLLWVASRAGGPLEGATPWVTIPVALLVFELAGYAYHRAAHVLPGLRELHDVHHSAERLDWLAGFRQHPVEILLMTLAQNLPLVLLGVPLGVHGLLAIALRVNTQFVHSNVRTPTWLGLLVATPAFHHRHHQRDGDVANYATLFPWIDRLFGTWCHEEAGQAGLPGRPRKGFVGWLLHPLWTPGYVRDGGAPCRPSTPSES